MFEIDVIYVHAAPGLYEMHRRPRHAAVLAHLECDVFPRREGVRVGKEERLAYTEARRCVFTEDHGTLHDGV